MEDPNSCEFRLVASFLAMEPINLLIPIARELGRGSITEEVQNFIHKECINNKICRMYPPSQLYVKHLLKQIIRDAESQFHDVLDAFYEKYAQYLTYCKDCDLSQRIRKCYRSLKFIFPATSDLLLASYENQRIRKSEIMTVTLRSSPNMLEGGTGCSIWPSSLFLSEFIFSHPHLFSSKRCFEVGSGAGLVGICLANVKASKIILSDGDLSALANLRHNLEINHVAVMEKKQENFQDSGLVECMHLKWESVSQDHLQNCCAEVILGADIIYDISCVPHLVQVLAALLQTKSLSSDLKRLVTNSKKSSFEGMIEEDKPENICNDNKDSSIFYRNAYPVAYIATVVRNIDTFNCFLRLSFEAGLRVINITKASGSLNLLPYLSSFDRSSVHLYMISALDSSSVSIVNDKHKA